MSQTSDGLAQDAQRRGSTAITNTLSPAAAFGDDDSYSVSEFSHYDEEPKNLKGGGKKKVGRSKDGPKFDGKSRSRLRVLDRKDSVQPDIQEPTNGHTEPSGPPPYRKGSTGSGENKSDEASSTPSPPSGDVDNADVTITTFASFAQKCFQTKIPHTYSCSALQEPLLPKPDKAEYLASLSSWVTLLRIMGDMPEVDVGDTLVVTGTNMPVVTRVKAAFHTKYGKKDVDEYLKKYSELFKDPAGSDSMSMPFLTKTSDTMLEKIQMLCALGIYKPSLRDELYCQLCKQLTGNPSRNSTARGWVLMYLMVSSFAPSEQFVSCLTTFLHEGPVEFADKVDLRLRRTCSVGTRGYPPSWLEFQAAKNGKPLLIPITFMNGHRMLYEMDGATSVGELVNALGQRLAIKDTGGFSVYITLQNKISCLGNGQHRVMDAVSECEQHSKMIGVKESNSSWRLFMRQEYFSPSQLVSLDPVSTDLAYHQMTKGISMGEYMFEKEEQLLQMASMIFKVEFPEDEQFEKLTGFLGDFIPENILERRAEGYFVEKVTAIVGNKYAGVLKREDVLILKKEVVQYIRENFSVMFSRYYDASRVTGQGFQFPDMVVGVNHKGVFLIDNQDKIKMAVDFCEVVEMSVSKNHVVMTLVGQSEMDLTMSHVEDFYDLVTGFLNGLSEVSTLALANKDLTQHDELPESSIVKGDLLEMSRPLTRYQRKDGYLRVICARTSMTADVPVEMLYILSTASKPTNEIMSKLVTQMRKDMSSMLPQQRPPITGSLQNYAKSKFRPDSESSVSKFLNKASFKRKSKNDYLWQYSKDLLKKPLLKKTCGRDDVRKLACHTFTSIQTYMAQLSINDEAAQYQLCLDWVLDPARRNKYARDEIYCQVVKQLTSNPDKGNEDRGWVLLCLLTSLTSPNQTLIDHIIPFVKTSTHPMAARCLANIKMQSRQGAYRLYSAHPLEHDMVVKQQPNVRYAVYFPNQTTQTIDVASQTRVYDMKKLIATRLKLKSFAEYSLFLTTNEKVHCLLDRSFYFDCMSHAEMYWFRNQRRQSSEKGSTTAMLVMLKKIWTNAQPGGDPVADTTFHFPQELPNFQRGYHDISLPNQVIRVAALVYRSLFGDDTSYFNKFGEISSQIFPQKFMVDKNAQEIQESVRSSYDSNKGMNQLEAKIKFLEELSSLTTYGSVFFEVKQRSMKSLPPFILIAINFSGVHVVDRETKKPLKTYEFYHIPNWAFDANSFTFIFNDGNATSKLLVETKVGHNIDDLLMSYIAWMMNFQMRQRYGYIGGSAGESIC